MERGFGVVSGELAQFDETISSEFLALFFLQRLNPGIHFCNRFSVNPLISDV